jgi:tRNA (mo5U34)-methyltransferase
MDATVSLREQVQSLDWVHTIDLGDGLVTPGAWPPSRLISRALDEIDFRGRKVLDVGCWDGLWSFEAEKRGAADVYATDCISQRPHGEQPTFALARRILDSRVRYYSDLSVYHLDRLGVADFDVVLFCGVYYHLKNPLLALAGLRHVMKPGGLLVIEGEVVNDYRNIDARFFYRESYRGDRSTWWIPTSACLRQWVECSSFEVERETNVARDSLSGTRLDRFRKLLKRIAGRQPEFSRSLLIARAVSRTDDNYAYPDEELARTFGC